MAGGSDQRAAKALRAHMLGLQWRVFVARFSRVQAIPCLDRNRHVVAEGSRRLRATNVPLLTLSDACTFFVIQKCVAVHTSNISCHG